MKTLRLDSGDLSLVGGDYGQIDGTAKVAQDLDGAFRERIRSDPYHPNWGSVLPFYAGEPLTQEMRQRCVSEVRRVINNYAAVQRAEVTAASTNGVSPRLSSGEMLQSVASINTTSIEDTLRLTVALTTLSGATVTVQPVVG